MQNPSYVPHPPSYCCMRQTAPLCLIHIILRLDFLYADLHAFLAKADILLLHLLGRLVRNIGRYRVYRIPDKGGNREDHEQDEKGDDLGEARHVWGMKRGDGRQYGSTCLSAVSQDRQERRTGKVCFCERMRRDD